jgi:hypothetical protein
MTCSVNLKTSKPYVVHNKNLLCFLLTEVNEHYYKSRIIIIMTFMHLKRQ